MPCWRAFFCQCKRGISVRLWLTKANTQTQGVISYWLFYIWRLGPFGDLNLGVVSVWCIPYSRKYWRGIKFGGLAVLEASRQIKIRQYIVTCAKTDRRFTMLRYFKRSRSSVCPSKVPFLTDEELRCASKKVESLPKEKASSSNERRGKYNTSVVESIIIIMQQRTHL